MSTNDRPADDIGMSPLSPYLVCDGAAAAIDFYRDAFGATEMIRLPGDDGKLMHACVRINGATVMLTDENAGCGAIGPTTLGGTPVTIHLVVPDIDASVERALAAGATVVMPVDDMFWGDRFGVIADPFGHHWSLSTPQRQLSEDEIRAAAKAAIAASRGEPA